MEAPLRYRVFAGILIFFAFVVVAGKTVDPDFYWHLRDGESILATHTVPRTDTYSYTMAGVPWVDHEWLVEAGFAWMWNHGLTPALDLIFAVIAFIPFVVWLRRYRSWPDLWVIAAGAALFMSFLAVKPQVISYLLFFVVYELLARYYCPAPDGGGGATRKKICLLVLPLVFFVWANIHAEFFSGLVLFGIFLATDVAVAWWRARREKKKFREGDIPFSIAMLVASVATPLLNPYGAGLYGEIFRVMFSANTMKYIQEWQSPFTTQATFSPATIAFAFLFSIFIFLAVRFRKQLTPARLAAAVAFFLFFAKAQRMGPLFVIAAMPIFYEGFALALAEAGARWHIASHRAQKIFRGIGAVLSIAAFCVVLLAPAALASTQYPVAAVNFLNGQNAATGNHIVILNFYGWGGYLDWNAPEIPVFIDGRMPHWTEPDGVSAMQDYVDLFLSPVSWPEQEAILKEWGVNTVLIQNPGANATGTSALFIDELESAGWATTYQDPMAIVLQCGGGSSCY